MRRLLPLAVAGALLLSLAACGSSDSSDSSTTTEPGTARERALANAGLLQQDDMAGYVAGDPNPSEAADLVDQAAKIPSCSAFVDTSKPSVIKGRSRSYQLARTIVDSSVAVYRTEADAAAQLEAWRDPAIVTCLQDFYLKAFEGSNVQSVSVSPVAPANVENGFGFLITATLPAETRLVGIQGVQVDRAIASINVAGPQESITRLETTVMPKLQQKMQAAVA